MATVEEPPRRRLEALLEQAERELPESEMYELMAVLALWSARITRQREASS